MGPSSRSLDMIMPAPIVVMVAALALIFVIRGLRHLDDAPTRFMVLALWARFVLSALHVHTFNPIVAGLSINAVSSIVIAVVSIWLAGARLLQLRHAATIYAVLAVVVVSSVLNNRPGGMVEYSVRYLFLLGVALLTYRGIRLFGPQPLLKALLPTLITPFLLQILSIAMGISKTNELATDTAAFIGGYYHESAFSMIVLFLMSVACLIRWNNPLLGFLVIIGGMISMSYANYRTNLLAAIPIFFVMSLFVYKYRVPVRFQPIGFLFAFVGFVLIGSALPYVVSERYAEIFHVLDEGVIFLEDPQILSAEQRRVFSSRIYIWANYIEGWRNGDIVERLIGQGASAWKGVMSKNSHNTFVGYIYEYGIIGIVVLLTFIIYQASLILRLPDIDTMLRAGACFTAWLIANFATEPFYAIEGLLLIGTVIGFTWAMLPVWPQIGRAAGVSGSAYGGAAPQALPAEAGASSRGG